MIRIVAALAVLLHPLQGPVTQVDGTPSCGQCSIELERILTIGSPSDSVLLDPGARPVRDSKGRYFAVGFGEERVLMYDEDGRLVKAFGRAGQGPGEFDGSPFVFVGPADSLYIVAGLSLQVWSPNQIFVRAVRLPRFGDPLPLPSGDLVLGGNDKPRGERLAIIAPDGRVRREIAPAPASDTACSDCSSARLGTTASGDGVWIAARNRHAFEEWRLDGGWRRTLSVRNSPWYKIGKVRPNPRTRPVDQPIVYRLRQTADSLLWTVAMIPHVIELRPFLDMTTARAMLSGQDSLNATVIEAIDLKARRVLASRTINGRYLDFSGDLVVTRRFDSDGVVSFEVSRLRLAQPTPR